MVQFMQMRVAVSVLMAMVVAGQNQSQSLVERDPCKSWIPLGNTPQSHSNLPYTALCDLSADGTQLISK